MQLSHQCYTVGSAGASLGGDTAIYQAAAVPVCPSGRTREMASSLLLLLHLDVHRWVGRDGVKLIFREVGQ